MWTLLLYLGAVQSLSGSHKLHVRNRHRGGYDMTRLAASFPALQPHIISGLGDHETTIDFSQPGALEALNAALLSVDYGVRDFVLPRGHLCPAVPGRADYLHLLADLLASEAPGGATPHGQAVRGLDVGVGASCIYPLIGHSEYGWSFVGSDVDERSLSSAALLALPCTLVSLSGPSAP